MGRTTRTRDQTLRMRRAMAIAASSLARGRALDRGEVEERLREREAEDARTAAQARAAVDERLRLRGTERIVDATAAGGVDGGVPLAHRTPGDTGEIERGDAQTYSSTLLRDPASVVHSAQASDEASVSEDPIAEVAEEAT